MESIETDNQNIDNAFLKKVLLRIIL